MTSSGSHTFSQFVKNKLIFWLFCLIFWQFPNCFSKKYNQFVEMVIPDLQEKYDTIARFYRTYSSHASKISRIRREAPVPSSSIIPIAISASSGRCKCDCTGVGGIGRHLGCTGLDCDIVSQIRQHILRCGILQADSDHSCYDRVKGSLLTYQTTIPVPVLFFPAARLPSKLRTSSTDRPYTDLPCWPASLPEPTAEAAKPSYPSGRWKPVQHSLGPGSAQFLGMFRTAQRSNRTPQFQTSIFSQSHQRRILVIVSIPSLRPTS